MRNNTRKANKKSYKQFIPRKFSEQVVTQKFIEQPFSVEQASSGTGGISSSGGSSGTSLTAVSSVKIDPFSIGGRLAYTAGMWLQYKLNYLELEFLPDASCTGYLENIAGGTTTPVMINRDFAWALLRDPAAVNAYSYTDLLVSGGDYGTTTRKHKLRIGSSPWLFTSTTSSYSIATTIDFRQAAPAILRFAFRQASTTGTQRYGLIICRASVSFRGPLVNTTVIGLSAPSDVTLLSQSNPLSQPENQDEKTE